MGSKINLYPWQAKALERLHSGCILFGGVGSGKTLTALEFYKKKYSHKKLFVITTPRKRDSKDWESEAESDGLDSSKITIDSWNNIPKYKSVEGCFIIFDEQRVVSNGAWAKNFIKIAKKNSWIMLSGTPGDTWIDYISVFIANGWYRNKSDFVDQHVEYNRFSKYPQVKVYHNEGKLIAYRNRILVPMKMVRKTKRVRYHISTEYDEPVYKFVKRNKVNVLKQNLPIKSAGEYTQVCRRIVATSFDRKEKARSLINRIPKVVVFYNYDYERAILLGICSTLGKPYAEWNGHRHESIPETDEWTYLVQYTAGAEAWNCTETDSMIFYSPNYSYKIMEQAEGRIDRLNTPFTTLKYYFLQSDSPIDKAVLRAIDRKKRFNAAAWAKKEG
jgi:hypothetical protein